MEGQVTEGGGQWNDSKKAPQTTQSVEAWGVTNTSVSQKRFKRVGRVGTVESENLKNEEGRNYVGVGWFKAYIIAVKI